MTQVEQLLGIVWTWEEHQCETLTRDKPHMLPWHDSIQTNGTACFDKGQAVHLMRQSQHLQDKTSPLGCRNYFNGHYRKAKNQP